MDFLHCIGSSYFGLAKVYLVIQKVFQGQIEKKWLHYNGIGFLSAQTKAFLDALASLEPTQVIGGSVIVSNSGQ